MENKYAKIKLCVSGSSENTHYDVEAMEKAKELGREIIRQGAILTTGTTTGFSLWAAMGAKEENGLSIGLSPASSELEHRDVYRLPLDYMDLIIYTGFGYAGSDLILTRSSDAIFVGCGGIGTLHEFTIAFEANKPIGILEGDWEMDEVIKNIIEKSHRTNNKVVFDSNPQKLVEKVITLIKEDKTP